MFTAISDYKYYMTSTMKTAVDDVVDGLTPEQRKAIWTKYGISPANYAFVQHAHTGVLNAAANIMANVAEEVVADKYGNITEASLGESMMYLFSDLSGHLAEVEQAIYKTAELSASKAIEEDAAKNAQADSQAQKEENARAKEAQFTGRARR